MKTESHSKSSISSNINYGYIVGIPPADTEGATDHYLVFVILERSLSDPSKSPILVGIEDSIESLASTYGEPENLIGRRVRLEYRGLNPTFGVAFITQEEVVERVTDALTLEACGFRHAIAGEVGVV